MNRNTPKNRQVIKRTAMYSATSLIVVAIATFLVFIILGYRLDTKNGQIEQNALVQFDSSPTGAAVYIDDEALGSSTTTKASVAPKSHHFSIRKEGYEAWNKELNTLSGTLYWLDYALLIPTVRTPEASINYTALHQSLASPKSRYMLVHKTPNDVSFDVVDLKNDTVTSKTVTLPAAVTNGLLTKKNLIFNIDSWDSGERYVLIKATADNTSQWIVLDTKSPENSKNITTRLDLDFSSIKFYDTSGNIFYVVASGDLRKIDLGADTISRPLVSKVTKFSIYDARWVFYIGNKTINLSELPVAGVYKDGDDNATVIYTATRPDENLEITSANYRNKDYIALSRGTELDVYIGSFPSYGDNFAEVMKIDSTMSITDSLVKLSFSPNANYLVAQMKTKFSTYYLEHKLNYVTDLMANITKLNWLNTDYLWSDFGGNMTIREFDGANSNNIMTTLIGQDAALTSNNKYIYAFQKTESGYSLSRVKININ